MRKFEQQRFADLGLPSYCFMENAARAICVLIGMQYEREAKTAPVLILAGGGNNGGDGYAIARNLKSSGILSSVACLMDPSKLNGDAKLSYDAFCCDEGELINWFSGEWKDELLMKLSHSSIVIDSIFGYGFRGELREPLRSFIEFFASCHEQVLKPVIAVDIPSGLNADSGQVEGPCIKATLTASLCGLKPCHVNFPAAEQCGNVCNLDIGLGEVDRKKLYGELVGIQDIEKLFPVHERDFHKGDKGRAFVLGGSRGLFGAAKLSGFAALRTGSGSVVLLVEDEDLLALSAEVTELMVGKRDVGKSALPGRGRKSSLLIGPGLGRSKEAKESMFAYLELAWELDLPTVIDADGLNLLADGDLKIKLPSKTVLTPHPLEAARLLCKPLEWVNENRRMAALEILEKFSSTTLLKGAYTHIAATEQEIYVLPWVSSALGISGSGDVLSGVIASLLAQGLEPQDAAIVGGWLHASAGVRAFQSTEHPYPSEFIFHLPALIKELRSHQY